MKLLLTKGYEAIVDADDYQRCRNHKWFADVRRRRDGSLLTVYATATIGYKKVRLHRFVLNLTDPLIDVDHANGNGLDNRRANLRIASVTQNRGNSIMQSRNTSGFKGVFWHKRDKLWQARIQCHGIRRSLGYFKNAADAARIYDAAAVRYFGNFALTNFGTAG